MFNPANNYNESREPKLVMISAPNCASCTSVENLFKSRDVQFEKLVIGEDLEREDFVKLSAVSRSFPVVYFGDREIVGQPALLKHVLDSKN